MASWKCSSCSLINKDTDQACRRCGAPTSSNQYSTAGPVNETPIVPAYGLPQNYQTAPQTPSVWGGQSHAQPAPVQDTGVWRDGSLLVMYKTASLPPRCLKCNAPTNGRSINSNLRAVDAAFGWLRYIPYLRLVYFAIRSASSKNAVVSLGVCQSHMSKVNAIVAIANVMRVVGFVMVIYGLWNSGLLLVIGLFVSVAGGALASRNWIVKVFRMDDYYVWLSGADPNYLAALPSVQR